MPVLGASKADLLLGLAQGHPLVDVMGETISLDELEQASRESRNPYILKVDTAQQIALGWAGQYVEADGSLLVDRQGDMIEPEEVEHAAYEFVLKHRDSGVMHEGKPVGTIVASLVTTPAVVKALFGPDVKLPCGWIIAVKYSDKAVFKKVVDGSLAMFSIQGRADRVEQ